MGLRWDIFCHVVDNWGDIGVCWRLAADLAARGERVRLWADDASALAWMAPTGCPGVQVLPWPVDAPPGGPGDVVVETFGCDLPPAFVAAIADAAHARTRAPIWVNLEYLSAERYVQRCHRLPSPISSGPGAGLTRWYFYPGFTERTGGLLREPDLLVRQQRFDRRTWRARRGVAAHEPVVTLFCYDRPALTPWLDALAAVPRAHLLVTPGQASALVHRWELENVNKNGRKAILDKREQLSVSYIDARPQSAFDELLWACDLNVVRGEDSLVRALWAGQALLWHIYPQDDDAHHAKLDAFLDWLQAPPSLRRAHHACNGIAPPASVPIPDATELTAWRACVRRARARLLAQEDLTTQLVRFVREKS
ncbi:MAG: elongation factor P maturation arginine rhamnosyltransferase EarP [Burkholderiales bacterium]|nr:elongation factor P maturation arginine rhamnosyltransferase EarP [Burkholderiales bacterium]